MGYSDWDKPIYGESIIYGDEKKSIQVGKWKLVYNTPSPRANESFELYNLAEDSKEHKNVILDNPEVASALKENLFQWMNTSSEIRPEDVITVNPTGELMEELRALGYMQ